MIENRIQAKGGFIKSKLKKEKEGRLLKLLMSGKNRGTTFPNEQKLKK